MSRRFTACSALGAVLVLAGLAPIAHASSDEPPSALVFGPHSGDDAQDARVVRAIRAELEALDVVELMPAPALDFEAMQLAIDCVGVDESCLSTMADRAKADVLVVSSVERSKGQVELRILRFDAEAGGEPQTVMRHGQGKKIGADLLDEIPAMVRELFAEAEEEPVVDEEAAPAEPAPLQSRSDGGDDLPLGPLLLAGGGAAVIVAGLAVGLVMNGTQSEYDDKQIATAADAEAAKSKRELGEKQAVIANVLLGTGAVALVAGGVWFALLQMDDESPTETAVVPVLGPTQAGLILRTSWQVSP